MFDSAPATRSVSRFSFTSLDPDLLTLALREWSDADIAALEDDLNFYRFTGAPSQRVLNLIATVSELRDIWSPSTAH